MVIFREEMISRMKEAPLPIRRKYRVCSPLSRRVEAGSPSRRVSRRRDVIDSAVRTLIDRGCVLFPPRLARLSVRFLSLFLIVAASRVALAVFHYFPTPACSFFVRLFAPYVSPALPDYVPSPFSPPRDGACPRRTWIRKGNNNRVRRERKREKERERERRNWFRFFVGRGVRWQPLPATRRHVRGKGDGVNGREKSLSLSLSLSRWRVPFNPRDLEGMIETRARRSLFKSESISRRP